MDGSLFIVLSTASSFSTLRIRLAGTTHGCTRCCCLVRRSPPVSRRPRNFFSLVFVTFWREDGVFMQCYASFCFGVTKDGFVWTSRGYPFGSGPKRRKLQRFVHPQRKLSTSCGFVDIQFLLGMVVYSCSPNAAVFRKKYAAYTPQHGRNPAAGARIYNAVIFCPQACG